DRGTEAGSAGRRREPAQQEPQQRRLAGAVGTGERDPVSCADLKRGRAERELAEVGRDLVERRDHGAGSRGAADRELEGPLLARLLDLLETGDPGLHLAHLLRLLLRRLRLRLAADLVVVRRLLHRVADALRAPLPLRPGPA